MDLHYSDSESRRFGLRVFRAVVATLDRSAVLESMLEHSVDLAILRVPPSALPNWVDLEQIGVPVVVADTLVHYWADLEGMSPRPPGNTDLVWVVPGAEELAGLVRSIFSDYVNHYRANPILPQESLREGYVEWASAFAADDASRTAAVALRDGRPVAFLTCHFATESVRVVLAGVVPSESGRGVYRDVIRYAIAQGKERGCRRVHVSTQVPNFPGQAVLAGEGFRLREAEVTLHLNALLDWPRRSLHRTDWVWSQEDLEGGGHWARRRLIDSVAEALLAEAHPGLRVQPSVSWHLEARPLRAGARYQSWFRVLEATRSRLAVLQVADAAAHLVCQAYYQLPGTDQGPGPMAVG